MDIADNVEFRNRLVVLAELFDIKLAATRQALYFEALRDLPFPAVATALNQAAKSCTFFPRPAELRAFALGDLEDTVEGAWMALRKAMRRVGGYASLVCPDAALGETVLALWGSWDAACACDLTSEMWASKRKEFGRVYRVYRGRQLDGARYLPGICEQQNSRQEAWKRFIPVSVMEGDGIRTLTAEEAESCRALLSAQSHEFARMDAERLGLALPVKPGETA